MCSYNKTEPTEDLRIVHIVCSLTLSILGMFGNFTSLVLICKARLFRGSPLMMLITDLCVANSLSSGVVAPVMAISHICRRWIFGETTCKLFGYYLYVAITSESLILTNLTVCQYFIVVHRVSVKAIFFNHCSRLRLFTLLGLPWVIPAGAYILPLTATWDTFGYDPMRGYCTLLNNQHDGLGVLAAACIILICIMTVVIFYCYPAILYIYIRSSKTARSRTNNRTRQDKVRGRHVQMMVSTIMINYSVTYLPFLIVSIADPCVEKISVSAYTAILYICFSHTAINPLIYALMNTRVNVLWKNAFLYLQCGIVRTFASEKRGLQEEM